MTTNPIIRSALVRMEVGPTGEHIWGSDPTDRRYGAHFDGGESVRRARAAHCEYVVVWGRDGDFACYDSKLLPKMPGLGVRDPPRATVEAAHPHAFPVFAYCVVQQGGHFVAEQAAYGIAGFHIVILDQGFGQPYG